MALSTQQSTPGSFLAPGHGSSLSTLLPTPGLSDLPWGRESQARPQASWLPAPPGRAEAGSGAQAWPSWQCSLVVRASQGSEPWFLHRMPSCWSWMPTGRVLGELLWAVLLWDRVEASGPVRTQARVPWSDLGPSSTRPVSSLILWGQLSTPWA